MGATDTGIDGLFYDRGGSGWRDPQHSLDGVKADGLTDDVAAWVALDHNWGYRVPKGETLIQTSGTLETSALSFAPGSVFKLANDVELEIPNAAILAGAWQIFDTSAPGSRVVLGNGVDDLRPEWWGAVADGVTDSIDAFDAFTEALGSGSGSYGKKGNLKKGIYRVSRQFEMRDVRAATITGVGRFATDIRWIGNDTDEMFLVRSCMDCVFQDFSMTNESGYTLAVAMRVIQGSSPDTYASSRNQFLRLSAAGRGGGLAKCYVVGGEGVDGNNDFMKFDYCTAESYTTCGAQIANSQSFDIKFTGCYFNSFLVSATAKGILHSGGNYQWIGGFMGLNQVDFYSDGDPNGGGFRIEDLNSEGSQRFIQTGGPSGALFSLQVINTRWASGNLHADGVAIDYRFVGPVEIHGGQIGNDFTKALKIVFNPAGGTAERVFSVKNVVVGTTLTTLAGIFTGVKPTEWDFRIFNGTTWRRLRDRFSLTKTINVASISANSTLQEVYTGIEGVEYGDQVVLTPVSALPDAGVVKAWERAETTDEIRVCWGNITGTPINMGAIDFRIDVFKDRG